MGTILCVISILTSFIIENYSAINKIVRQQILTTLPYLRHGGFYSKRQGHRGWPIAHNWLTTII